MYRPPRVSDPSGSQTDLQVIKHHIAEVEVVRWEVLLSPPGPLGEPQERRIKARVLWLWGRKTAVPTARGNGSCVLLVFMGEPWCTVSE